MANKKQNISWKKSAIKSLIQQGIDRPNAERIYSSAYQQARRRLRKETSEKNINIAFETFSALAGRTDSLFDITLSNDKIKISTQLRYHGQDLETAYVNSRFEGMAKAYSEVAEYLDQYNNGELTYREYIDKIMQFKKTNPKYWRGKS